MDEIRVGRWISLKANSISGASTDYFYRINKITDRGLVVRPSWESYASYDWSAGTMTKEEPKEYFILYKEVKDYL